MRKSIPRALELLEQAAQAGNVQAAWSLHYQFTDGPYVVHNAQAATDWLVRAAELGSGQAACLLAQMLDGGTEATPPAEQVLALLEQASAGGDAEAQASLGIWHLERRHGLDGADALRLLHRAALGGNAFAQAWLGDALATGQGVNPNLAEAAIWYERAALQGHGGATRALTSMSVAAGSQPEQMARLFNLWLKGAERGDAIAQRVIGDFYMRGVGVEHSPQHAEQWLTASVEQGDTAAMVLLGGLILASPENAPRFPQAVALFRRAKGKGNTDAEYNLGVCLRRGLGVIPNNKAAERHYRAAAERNHVSAQLALGDLIAERAATDAEWLEADHWYRLAAASGNNHAQARLTGVEQRRSLSTTEPKGIAAQG